MSCNCKNKARIESENGTKQEESISSTLGRYVMMVVMTVIVVLVALIVTPIIMCTFVYKVIFTKDMTITLPKFMGKYMK